MVKGTQKKQWCIGGVYLAVTLLVYYKTIFLGFFSDDYHFLSVISNADNVWHFFLSNNVGESFGGSYGPVLDVLWFFQYHLFGMHAWMYHIVVLLAYAATAYMVHKLGEPAELDVHCRAIAHIITEGENVGLIPIAFACIVFTGDGLPQ